MKEEKKKESNFWPVFWLIVIIAGVAFYFLYFNTYYLIPTKDMSGSEYVGTWEIAGAYSNGNEFFPKEESYFGFPDGWFYHLELREDGKAGLIFDGGASRYGSWSDDGNGETLTFKPNGHDAIKISIVYGFDGVTPQSLGYSSDYFLVSEEYGPDHREAFAK